LLPVGVEQLYT